MALIEESEGRKNEEIKQTSYYRIFRDVVLAKLISKVHATSIRQGNELETIILGEVDGKNGVSIEAKKKYPNLKVGGKGIVIDFVVQKAGTTYICEVKDGDTFDTKKADGEKESLNLVKVSLEKKGVSAVIVFCSFNAKNREQIVKGSKNRFSKKEVMTGREFCKLIGASYVAIEKKRQCDVKRNNAFFKKEIGKWLKST